MPVGATHKTARNVDDTRVLLVPLMLGSGLNLIRMRCVSGLGRDRMWLVQEQEAALDFGDITIE